MADNDDDLDADFLRLQEELGQLPKLPSSPQISKNTTTTTAIHHNNNNNNTASVVVKAQASAKPAWQLGLLERDRIQLEEAAAVRKQADKITGKSTTSDPNQSSEPSGEWKWNGSRWEWKMPSSSNATTTSAISNATTPAAPTYPPLGHVNTNNTNTNAKKKKVAKRMAAGEVWKDASLAEWPEGDFRIFVGDLAPDATDEELAGAFGRYASFNMARVVKDKRTAKCRGYGFVSFASGKDMAAALREMNGKYVGSRPVKLKRSNWHKRNLTDDRKQTLKAFRSIRKPNT